MKVLGAEVARVTRSAAARGDVADLLRARNGYCSVLVLARRSVAMLPGNPVGGCGEGWVERVTNLQRVQCFSLLHVEDISLLLGLNSNALSRGVGNLVRYRAFAKW